MYSVVNENEVVMFNDPNSLTHDVNSGYDVLLLT